MLKFGTISQRRIASQKKVVGDISGLAYPSLVYKTPPANNTKSENKEKKEGRFRTPPYGNRREGVSRLVLNLGCSHPKTYAVPERDVRLSVRNAQSSDANVGSTTPKAGKGGISTTKTSATISIFGISHFKVHQMAAEIARYKEPEVYSGKGINHDGQKCFLKKRNEPKGQLIWRHPCGRCHHCSRSGPLNPHTSANLKKQGGLPATISACTDDRTCGCQEELENRDTE